MQLEPIVCLESNEANVQSMEFALPETAAITADDMINCLLPAVKDILKSHQRDGIKFFFQRIIVEKSGAILAHNMGLGKTLTTLAFLYATLELYKKQILKVIIVVPVGVLRQWNQEYEKWFGNSSSIFVMDEKPSTRINTIFEWISDAEKNIMIIGYTKFVDVMHDVNGATALQSINLIVFDEAHKMKTETTNVYKIAEMVTTPLKIFLSGTPLQNNVMEYYNMMQLISPNILCDREEFKIS
uniref:Helicase ATP-binding domain-containing protein n=1 Tax=Panagrolaimus superbus TaxID=310955 RepID=A0A914XQJ4_9BILA